MLLPGSTPVTASERRSKSDSDVGLIDCDVHHWLKNLDELLPYLSAPFQRQVKEQGFLFPGSGYFNAPRQAVRRRANHRGWRHSSSECTEQLPRLPACPPSQSIEFGAL